DGALDASLHLDEGSRCAPYFARTAGTEIRHFTPLAETLGGISQPENRLDLIAQEYDCDNQQNRRCANHPKKENLRIGYISRASTRKHSHHRIVELNADFEQCRLADSIDPVGSPDLLAEFFGQCLVQQRKEGFRPRGWHLRQRQEINHEAEPLLRDAPDL